MIEIHFHPYMHGILKSSRRQGGKGSTAEQLVGGAA
jgi:hypothetical protein